MNDFEKYISDNLDFGINLNNDDRQKIKEKLLVSLKNLIVKAVEKLARDHLKDKFPNNCIVQSAITKKTCDFLVKRHQCFMEAKNADFYPSHVTTDNNNQVIIKGGSLFHGTRFTDSSYEKIASIAQNGLLSGQFIGINEENETYYCIDFWKAPHDFNTEYICNTRPFKTYVGTYDEIVFVIDPNELNGPTALIPQVTSYDGYNKSTPEGLEASKLLSPKAPGNYMLTSAIVIGLPTYMISAIIVNEGIEKDIRKIDFLSQAFPKASIVSAKTGIIIREPTITNNIKL